MRAWPALFGLLAVAIALTLFVSKGGPDPARVWSVLTGRGSTADQFVLWELRLPRLALAALIGAGLGGAGAALQGYFRNPLADPGIVGVGPFASLAAVLALHFGLTFAGSWSVPISALVGAGVGAGLLFLLAGPGASAATLILAGVALAALASALTALALSLAPNPWALAEISYWLMGSVRDRGWAEVGLAAPLIIAGLVLLTITAPALRTLSIGEMSARTLGVRMGSLQALLVAGAALAVGPGVAVAGGIGFVGLVAPHLVRGLMGPDPARLLLPSMLLGATLVIAADWAVRWLSQPGMPLYLGVVTALIGAPFFLWLVLRARQGGAGWG